MLFLSFIMQKSIIAFSNKKVKKTNLVRLYKVKKGSKEYRTLMELQSKIVIYRKVSNKSIGKMGEVITIYKKERHKDGFFSIDHFATIKFLEKKDNKYIYYLEKLPIFPDWLKTKLAKRIN